MEIHSLLVDLENLHVNKRFDPEDRALMKQYMIELSNLEALQVLRQNPVFQGLIKLYLEEIKTINIWLLDNAKKIATGNNEVKSMALGLISKKEVLKSFIDHYSYEAVDLVTHIRERVDKFLVKQQ